MSVRVALPAYFQPFTDSAEVVEVEGSTVGECLDHLVKQFPGIDKMLLDKKDKLHNYVGIYVNGKDVYHEGLSKPVKDGDELYVLYIISGG